MGKAEALRLAVTGAAGALIAAAFDPRCAACAAALDSPLRGPVCGVCWDEAHRSAGSYEGALRAIIHAFKYDGHTSLASPLAAMLRARSGNVLADASCVVPVPLFAWRRLRRGFNQAAALARHLDLPVVPALWRVRSTSTQTGLSAAERQRNVRGAFALSPWLPVRTRERHLRDRIVVLIDDVMTTGATLNACAAVLEAAGAREVRPLTIARAPLTHRG